MHGFRRGTLALLALVLCSAGAVRSASALLGAAESVPATASTASSFGGTVYYLHNSPTPPTDDTLAQTGLAMNGTAPTATILHNYDTDLDALPGRVIQLGGAGPTEADLNQHVSWRGPTAGLAGQTISGTVTVEIWSASDGFAPATAGELRAFLRDVLVLTDTATEIATASVAAADWQGASSGWVKRTLTMSVSHTLLVGHALELKIVAGPDAASDMLVAYDTTVHRARVRIP